MNNNNIDAFMIWHEGNELQPYQDVSGIWTIGVGHVILPNEQQYMSGITAQQSLDILHTDQAIHYATVDRLVTVPITSQQRDALMDFCFGDGDGAFGSSTLLQLINSNAATADIENEFMKWNHATVNGQLVVVPMLTKIRAGEIAMWNNSALSGFSNGSIIGTLSYFQTTRLVCILALLGLTLALVALVMKYKGYKIPKI